MRIIHVGVGAQCDSFALLFKLHIMVELEWDIVEIRNCMLSRAEWDWKVKEITKNN
jgi:hypothetical protein